MFSSTKKKTLEYFTFEVKKKPMFELQEGTPSHEQLQLPQPIFRPSYLWTMSKLHKIRARNLKGEQCNGHKITWCLVGAQLNWDGFKVQTHIRNMVTLVTFERA